MTSSKTEQPRTAAGLTFVEEAELMGERLPQTPTARRLLNEFRDYGWVEDFLAIEAEAAGAKPDLLDELLTRLQDEADRADEQGAYQRKQGIKFAIGRVKEYARLAASKEERP